MALLALPSNFKWKLKLGIYTHSYVATSNQGFIIIKIVKTTPPPLLLAKPDQLEKSLKRKEYETNKTFKNIFATKLLWVEYVIGSNGKISQVKCIICNQIRRLDKPMALKLDGLYKHYGKKKAQVDTLGQPKNVSYFESNSMHQKNEKQFASQSHTTNVF
jgi:hypothetical protein